MNMMQRCKGYLSDVTKDKLIAYASQMKDGVLSVQLETPYQALYKPHISILEQQIYEMYTRDGLSAVKIAEITGHHKRTIYRTVAKVRKMIEES
jgi:hypothetical protein